MSLNIIKDSSVYKNPNYDYLSNNSAYSIRVGMIRQHFYDQDKGETRYVVEVWKNNRLYPMNCIRGNTRFGGLYNFEEFTYRGFEASEDDVTLGNFEFMPGDMVIVAAADGNSREGFILSAMNHFGRPERIPANKDTAYVSEFNGLEKTIGYSGAYTVTFKGKPTNMGEITKVPTGEELPLPEYDSSIAGSYYKFNKEGSFTVCDNTDNEQSVHIDKPGGQIVITSGKTTLTIDKDAETYEIVNKSTTIASEDDFLLETKKTKIDSTDEIDMETKKFKTKGDWEEEGNKIIEGAIFVKGPTGNVFIDGNLTTLGITSLSGGQFALVYDVILSIGSGNLGLPVVSQLTLLKTTLTRAT